MREEKKQEQAIHKSEMESLRNEFEEERKKLESALLAQKKQHLQDVSFKFLMNKMAKSLEKQAIEREQWQEMYMKKIEAEIQMREVCRFNHLTKEIFQGKTNF